MAISSECVFSARDFGLERWYFGDRAALEQALAPVSVDDFADTLKRADIEVTFGGGNLSPLPFFCADEAPWPEKCLIYQLDRADVYMPLEPFAKHHVILALNSGAQHFTELAPDEIGALFAAIQKVGLVLVELGLNFAVSSSNDLLPDQDCLTFDIIPPQTTISVRRDLAEEYDRLRVRKEMHLQEVVTVIQGKASQLLWNYGLLKEYLGVPPESGT